MNILKILFLLTNIILANSYPISDNNPKGQSWSYALEISHPVNHKGYDGHGNDGAANVHAYDSGIIADHKESVKYTHNPHYETDIHYESHNPHESNDNNDSHNNHYESQDIHDNSHEIQDVKGLDINDINLNRIIDSIIKKSNYH